MRYKYFILFIVLLLILTGCSKKETVFSSISTESTVAVTETTVAVTESPPEITEPLLQTYPLNIGKAYADFAITLPDHIYNTLGSENGLGGTIYSFDGTVTSIEDMKANGFTYPLAVIETDNGPVMILDMYTAVYNASLKRSGKANTISKYDDNPAFYQFPEIGETANFITVYMGYSSVKELPTFIYGASPDIFTIGEYNDPVFAAFSSE